MTSQAPIPSDEVPAPPIGPSGQDQIKLGGAVIGQFMSGRNRLSPNATLESQNFETGVAGFQLTGQGAAEFGDMTVRGDITGATLVGTFKTSTTGARMEAYDVGSYAAIDMYSGIASENAGRLYASTGSGRHTLNLSGGYVTGVPQSIRFSEATSGLREIYIDGGQPSGGAIGPIRLQTADGKISGRGYDMAPMLNVTTKSTGSIAANGTISGNALNFSNSVPQLYMQAQTIPLYAVGGSPGQYYGTYPVAFTTGVLALTLTLVRDWAANLIAAPAPNYTVEIARDITAGATPLSAFYVFVYDHTGAAVTANLACSFVAVGW